MKINGSTAFFWKGLEPAQADDNLAHTHIIVLK